MTAIFSFFIVVHEMTKERKRRLRMIFWMESEKELHLIFLYTWDTGETSYFKREIFRAESLVTISFLYTTEVMVSFARGLVATPADTVRGDPNTYALRDG